jgi:hypothetical protein
MALCPGPPSQQEQRGLHAAPIERRHHGNLQLDRAIFGMLGVFGNAQRAAARGKGGQMKGMLEPALGQRQRRGVLGQDRA